MGLPVTTVASGGLPIVETTRGMPVTETTRGVPVTKVVGKPGLPVVFVNENNGPAFTATAFNPATVTNTSLSNGNLTATHTNTTGNSGARSVSYQTAGKFYFEITVGSTHGATDCIGLSIPAGTYANMDSGGVNNGVCAMMTLSSGLVYTNGTSALVNMGAWTAGDVICVAVDNGNAKVWFRRNGGNWQANVSANPATNTLGTNLASVASGHAPMVVFDGTGTLATDNYTANFGGSAFAQAVPVGFTSGWPA